MFDLYQRIEENSRKIARLAGLTLQFLRIASPNESPAKYQSVIRNAAMLKDLWNQHVQLVNALDAPIHSYNRQFADLSDRRSAETVRLECMLELLASAVWPRFPQSGLESIRAQTVETLTSMLRLIEREKASILFSSRHQVHRSDQIPV